MHLGSQLHAPHKLAGAESRMWDTNWGILKASEYFGSVPTANLLTS